MWPPGDEEQWREMTPAQELSFVDQYPMRVRAPLNAEQSSSKAKYDPVPEVSTHVQILDSSHVLPARVRTFPIASQPYCRHVNEISHEDHQRQILRYTPNVRQHELGDQY